MDGFLNALCIVLDISLLYKIVRFIVQIGGIKSFIRGIREKDIICRIYLTGLLIALGLTYDSFHHLIGTFR